MKARHWILAIAATLLLAGGMFVLLIKFGDRIMPTEPEPEYEQPTAGLQENWDTYEAQQPVAKQPTRADTHKAMQMNVVPGVTRTRERLNNIERAREDLRESAGEDAPERY
ncbi:hypothetical protein KQI84_09630 [bacterium]|nr:hypothetical protein [bacterium]